jgi:hypothetical protein
MGRTRRRRCGGEVSGSGLEVSSLHALAWSFTVHGKISLGAQHNFSSTH